jgi:hypothetical protein
MESNARTVMTDSQPSADMAPRPHLSQRVTRTLVRGNKTRDQSGNVDAGLGQGMEMALTVAVFLGLGWLADRALGTSPTFMVALVIFGMVGQSARMWFTYDAHMRTLEAQRRQHLAEGRTQQSSDSSNTISFSTGDEG